MMLYNKKVVLEHYNDYYTDKGFNDREFALYKKYFELLLKRTSLVRAKRNQLLDLGCGYGVKTIAFGDFFDRTLGVDMSKSAIESAEKLNRNDKIRFICDDMFNLTQDHFDVISALGFSFFNEEDIPVLVERLTSVFNRFLSSDGVLILSSQTDFSGECLSGWVMHNRAQLTDLKGKLQENGFNTEIYFPQKDTKNFLNFGLGNFVKESVKRIKSKKRIFFLVISKQTTSN